MPSKLMNMRPRSLVFFVRQQNSRNKKRPVGRLVGMVGVEPTLGRF
jgi:hypothetical protein